MSSQLALVAAQEAAKARQAASDGQDGGEGLRTVPSSAPAMAAKGQLE